MAKKVPRLGIALALALILSYVESLIPFFFSVPGMKLGLVNIIIIIILYIDCWQDAILVSIMRVLLAGFMFGNVYSIVYSLSGAILSFVIMLLLKNVFQLHIIVVSIFGGVFHNIGQILIAAVIASNVYIMGYLPALYIAGMITGLLIGILAYEMYPRITKIGRI
ncbi:MAG: Gx transporter family protein [Lachnospiraceae bacterium]|nr:Gx transporter family protein [Lachnospiraceae bacterium]